MSGWHPKRLTASLLRFRRRRQTAQSTPGPPGRALGRLLAGCGIGLVLSAATAASSRMGLKWRDACRAGGEGDRR